MKRMLFAAFGAVFCLSAQMPDFTPPTPLFGALLSGNGAAARRLLEEGADPNQGRFLGSPAIIFAVGYRDKATVEAMIAKGADVKATDPGGSTTLMWAAYNEAGDSALVDRLLQLGVDPNAKNQRGETALMWAMRRGSTQAVESLRKAGASDREMVRQSVEKAVALLQKSGPEFIKVSGCSSCHHQSLPQMAYASARQRGFAVDPQVSQQQVKAVMAMFRPYTEAMATGKANLPDPSVSVSYSLLGLAAESYQPDATTAAMAQLISTQQTADGSFMVMPMRPPIESNRISATALSMRSLQLYGKDADERIARARKWLESAAPANTEERAMQLLGMSWAGSSAALRQQAADALVAEQRPDGGWAQLAKLESDAYATGQAMVALLTSGVSVVSRPAYTRGVDFLLRTQMADGSWLVRSRSNPFQPYKESGFPHGAHQWISAAGTSWAAMALSLTQPVVGPQVSRAGALPAAVE